MHSCKQPDRHEPKLICGYPLPCPYHTAVIDMETETVTIPFLFAKKARRRVIDVAQAFGKKKK